MAQGIYKYENANYVIAGFIIETIVNSTFEEVASTRLFKPLGMSSAGFGPVPESSNTSVDNPWPHLMEISFPTPLDSADPIHRDNSPALAPAGGAYCTLSDYGKFLQLQLDGVHGRINATSPFNLSIAGFRHLRTIYSNWDNENSYTYGGWSRRNLTARPDDYQLAHEGSNFLNFARAEIYMRPDTAYMAMTNVANTSSEIFSVAIHSIIQDKIYGKLLNY